MQYTIQPTPDALGAMREHRLSVILLLRRIALFCFIASVVLSVYYFRDNIKNAVADARLQTQLEEKQAYASSRIYFEPDSTNLYALYGNDLAVLNHGTFKLYDPTGKQQAALQLGYSRPGMNIGKTYVALFDRGNKALTLLENDEIAATLTMSGGVIAVSQSDDGLLAVVHGDDRYRTVVSVYDNQQELIYEWKSSEYYLSDAVLSPDGKHMAVVALTQKNGDFYSHIVLFSLESEDPLATYDMTGTVAAALYFLNGESVCVVGDDRAAVIDLSGQELCTYDYGAFMLKTCAAGDGYVVLAMLNRSSGLGSKLVLLSAGSPVPVSKETSDEVRRLAASGGNIAVLYTSSVQMLNSALEAEGQPVEVGGVQNLLIRPDALVLLLYSSEAGYADIVTPFKEAASQKEAAS